MWSPSAVFLSSLNYKLYKKKGKILGLILKEGVCFSEPTLGNGSTGKKPDSWRP